MIAATGVASCVAVLTTAAAYAAYGSPSLEASHDGNSVTLDVAQSPGDDATALIRIISPLQTEIAAQPAGTTIGSGSATFVATAVGNTELSADGRLEVVDAGPIDAGTLTGCAVSERVVALWRLRLAGTAISVDVPVHLLVGGDLLMCFAHPSSHPQGAMLVSLRLTVSGALRLRPVGTWISIWVPYVGVDADPARAVASPAVVGSGSVTFTARTRGPGAVLKGIVRQGGAARADARVRITGGATASSQRPLGSARTNRVGRFTFHARAGSVFRATATAERVSPPGICFALEPFLRPIPCVNPTLGGLTARSATVRKR
ncbi:MAG TPA: hypothetical protein VEW90_10630 [Gaiellaceae bacterium]|nr:hypothetical protein [Gaiellaceae bacterium]